MFRSVSISTDSLENVNTDDETPLDDALVSTLAVIEEQPLESRAAAYAQLHEQLRERLEGGDVPTQVTG